MKTKFRKKPIVIEAEQFFYDQKPWPEGVEMKVIFTDDDGCPHSGPVIETLEGNMRVAEGDWVITGVKGERYPCKPDIFEATYDAVEEGEETQ